MGFEDQVSSFQPAMYDMQTELNATLFNASYDASLGAGAIFHQSQQQMITQQTVHDTRHNEPETRRPSTREITPDNGTTRSGGRATYGTDAPLLYPKEKVLGVDGNGRPTEKVAKDPYFSSPSEKKILPPYDLEKYPKNMFENAPGSMKMEHGQIKPVVPKKDPHGNHIPDTNTKHGESVFDRQMQAFMDYLDHMIHPQKPKERHWPNCLPDKTKQNKHNYYENKLK